MANKANINTSKATDCDVTSLSSESLCYPKTFPVKSLNTLKTLIDKTVCPEETDDCSLSKDSLVYPSASTVKNIKVKATITLFSNWQYVQCTNLPDWTINSDYNTTLTTASNYRENDIEVDVIVGFNYDSTTSTYVNITDTKTQAIHSVYVNYGQFTATYTEGETTQAEINALQEGIDNTAILYGYSLLQCGFTNLDNTLYCPTISEYTSNNYVNNIINPTDTFSTIPTLTYRENLSNVLTDDIYLGNASSSDVLVDEEDETSTVSNAIYELQTYLNATITTYLQSNLNCIYTNDTLTLTCPEVDSEIVTTTTNTSNVITINGSIFTLTLNGIILYDSSSEDAVSSFESFLTSFESYIHSNIVCYYTNVADNIYCNTGYKPSNIIISTIYEGTYSDVLTYSNDSYGININIDTLDLLFNIYDETDSETELISNIETSIAAAKESAKEITCYIGNTTQTATCNTDSADSTDDVSSHLFGLTEYTVSADSYRQYYSEAETSSATYILDTLNASAFSVAESALVCLYGNASLNAKTCAEEYEGICDSSGGFASYSKDLAAVAANMFIASTYGSANSAAIAFQLASALCLCKDAVGYEGSISTGGSSGSECTTCGDKFSVFHE